MDVEARAGLPRESGKALGVGLSFFWYGMSVVQGLNIPCITTLGGISKILKMIL